MAPRVRHSIQHLQFQYDVENRAPLEKLIKAWRGIQALPSHDANSFFNLAGYHGEPFRGPGATDPRWWGGYCNHGNVLFPTWHRAYLWRVEEALRSIEGCEDVTLPYWDELADVGTPIPAVLTSPTFPLDGGGGEPNPLYSYALAEAIRDNVQGDKDRYAKPQGYTTVRYPQSGLVGTPEARKLTALHNLRFGDAAENARLLNDNVRQWNEGTIEFCNDHSGAGVPDTYSVRARWLLGLQAPDYTVFSNTTSQAQYIKQYGPGDPHIAVSLESPHNAIHLAIGGFYQRGVYNASPVINANGDMGANEMAGFDPIFHMHHCWVDHVFWTWQQRTGKTARGSLDVTPYDPGTIVPEGEGLPNLPPGTALTMQTALYPFRHDGSQRYMTSDDVTDIGEMGYAFGPGSLAPLLRGPPPPPSAVPEMEKKIVAFKRVQNIDRARYAGSFVVRTFVGRRGGKAEDRVEIGREPVLSRLDVKGCANCRDKLEAESLVPIYEGMLEAVLGEGDAADAEFTVDMHTNDSLKRTERLIGDEPVIDDLWA